MTTLTQVSQTMQTVLTVEADNAARQTGFVQRQSKLTGAKFAQTLVLGWLSNPQATLEELAQTAATLGVKITPQGLEQRFTRPAAQCLQQVLASAVRQGVAADPVALPLLQRFRGVYLQDSSTLTLPDALAEVWTGCGGSTPAGTQAALKLQVCLDLGTGALNGPQLHHGRSPDQRAALSPDTLPAGALWIADLGYFRLAQLRQLHERGVYFLSRLQAQTAVWDAPGQQWELGQLLREQDSPSVELSIRLGAEQQVPCRLLARRVPLGVAEQRRRRLRAEARRRGRMVSAARLALADWTVYVTNAPAEVLTLGEAMVLGRARWQIELLFKLWKSQGEIDEWRSHKPWRILCEIYAKLLAMLVQHWILLVSCWQYADRSLRKAAKTVQRQALHWASVFGKVARLCQVLHTIARCLAAGCRINKRKTAPHTYQLLLQPTPEGLT